MADNNTSNFGENVAIDIAMNVAMGNLDPASIATDIILDTLIDSLISHYSKASEEVSAKADKYMKQFQAKDKIKQKDLSAGKITEKQYNQWRLNQVKTGKKWKQMSDTLAEDLSNANQIAADLINGRKPSVYALNHNFGTFEIERGAKISTSYTLYSHETVENLIKNEPNLLPKTKVNIPKDIAWNKKKIDSAITQGILQGDSLSQVSERLKDVTNMNSNSAIRNARTAMTGAQNAGRIDAYKRAENLGVEVKKVWLATLDGHTRHSHRMLDGEKVDLDAKFSNGCRFPGDPEGPGQEVYNCRCTLLGQPKGVDFKVSDLVQRDNRLGNLTYEDFKGWLSDQAAPDSAIMNIWSNMKMSNIYNLIKAENVTDANKFYNELKKLGKPSDVWDKYLTGQIDSADLEKFENILKKYLPTPASEPISANPFAGKSFIDMLDDPKLQYGQPAIDYLTDNYSLGWGKHLEDWANGKIADSKLDDLLLGKKVTQATDKIDDISNAAKAAEKQLNVPKGEPMSVIDADNHNVNVFYDKLDQGTLTNCQTSTFAYECRRQGYDVIALPKYEELDDIYDLQHKLGQNQGLGWINKKTGLAPESLVGYDEAKILAKSDMLNDLEKYVGKDGERYSLGIHWKNADGSHSVNIDRDENGLLRIIDNQRGPMEKNSWVGEEVEDYLDNIKNIKSLQRLDDCVPNPEYFNKIVVDASKVTDKDDFLMKHLNKTADKVASPTIGELLDATKEFEKIKKMPVTDLDDMAEKLTKEYHGMTTEQAKDVLKKTGLDIPESAIDYSKYGGKEVFDIVSKYDDYHDFLEHSPVKEYKAVFNEFGSKSKVENAIDEAKQLKKIDTAPMPEPHDILKVPDAVDDISDIKKTLPLHTDYHDFLYDLDAEGHKDIADSIWYEVGDLAKKTLQSEDMAWDKYLKGMLSDHKIDDMLKQVGYSKPSKPVTSASITATTKKADNFFDMAKADFSEKEWLDIYDDVWKVSHDTADNISLELYKLKKQYGFGDKEEVLYAYFNKGIGLNDKKGLDDLFEKYYDKKNPQPKPASKATSKITPVAQPTPATGQKVVDIDSLKSKKVTQVYNEIKADIGSSDANAFYNELKKIGKVDGLKQGDVWKKYLANELDASDVQKIEKHLIGKYNKVVEPEVNYSALSSKKMSQVYNELKAENTTNANKFYNELKSIGKPSDVWEKYIKGELTETQTKSLDKYLISKYNKGGVATVSTQVDTTQLKKLQKQLEEYKKLENELINGAQIEVISPHTGKIEIKQAFGGKEDLDFAFNDAGYKPANANTQKYIDKVLKVDKDDIESQIHNLVHADQQVDDAALKAAQKELKDAEKALKDNVDTSAVWEGIWKDDVKVSDYESKKSTIAAKKIYYEDEIEKLTNDPSYQSWLSQEDKEQKIFKYQHLYDDLEDFEEKGKAAEKYYQAVKEAQEKVKAATPVGEMYTQERKDAAKWYTKKSYPAGDRYYTAWAKPIHATATPAEHSAYKSYTSASGGFNRPLTGFKAPAYSGASGWDEKYFKGVGKVPLDNEGKGTHIKNLTTFIEKSKTKDDIWIQTAQNYATLEGKNGFLGIDYGSLAKMSDEELSQFEGKVAEFGQFISGSINRGGGSYTPGKVRINIYCPKGSEALYVLSDGAFGKSEHEIILQRGGSYRITKMYWGIDVENGGKKLMVDMELLLEQGYDKYVL